MHRLSNIHGERRPARRIECRCAGDDAVEILRETLRFLECLSSTGRATIEVRELGAIAIVSRNDRLGLHGHFVDRPVAKVDQLFRTLHPWAAAAFMPSIGAGRGITAPETRRKRIDVDVSIPAAVSNGLEFAVPSRRREPDFDFDIGVGRGFQSGCHAAKAGQIVEAWRRATSGRRHSERPGGYRLRHRDCRVRQLKPGQALARPGRCGQRSGHKHRGQERGNDKGMDVDVFGHFGHLASCCSIWSKTRVRVNQNSCHCCQRLSAR